FSCADLSILFREKIAERFWLRDQRGERRRLEFRPAGCGTVIEGPPKGGTPNKLQTKNLQTPAKRRMKASNESCRKPSDRLASSFSLTEKLVPHLRDQTSTAKPIS